MARAQLCYRARSPLIGAFALTASMDAARFGQTETLGGIRGYSDRCPLVEGLDHRPRQEIITPSNDGLRMLLPGVAHLYPVVLQRSMMLRLQPLLVGSGAERQARSGSSLRGLEARFWGASVSPVRYRAMSICLSLRPRCMAGDIPTTFVEREGICVARRGCD